MPELAELHLMSEYIQKYVNLEIDKIEQVGDCKVKFDQKLYKPSRLINATSRGKELKLDFNCSSILCTMGMSGNWSSNIQKHSRLIIYFKRGQILTLTDPRRFAKWKWSINWSPNRSPDPLKESIQWKQDFKDKLSKLKKDKCLAEILMDQSWCNGIGNYLRAEILYRSDLNPFSSVKSLKKSELELLFKTVAETCEQSLIIGGGQFLTFKNPNGQTSYINKFKDWLQCYSQPNMSVIDIKGRKLWYNSKWNNE